MRKRWALKCYIGIAIVTVLLNVIALSSTAFSDAYIANVFPLWVNTYGRLTGLFPFSVGEWMLLAGALLVILAVALGLGSGLALVIRLAVKAPLPELRSVKRFYLFFAWVALIVSLIMTLNCSMLYRASTFSQKYFGEDTQEYDLLQLMRVYNHVASRCNMLCEQMARDEQEYVIYPGGVSETGKLIDMEDKARETMRQLGRIYPQLDGYYPRPKVIFFSDFMCQQYMLGWYFPFSMEANYNNVAYILNHPASLCHELAHLRGYIYEDEANFISYLACVESDDIYFQYSGYLSVLTYLENDLRNAAMTDPEAFAAAFLQIEPVYVEDQVYFDDIFVKNEDWERIEENAVIDTETVDQITDAYVDTALKAYGVSDGKISYSRVVRLLLQYYTLHGELLEGD